MIKRLLIALLAFVSCLGLNAQTNPPDAFVYQGVAKNPGTGGIASKTKVRLKVQVLQGGPNGPMVFEEHHNTTTNADGIFSVLVGRGIKLAVTTYSSLYDIPWSQDSFYFSLSMSIAMKFPPNSYSPYLPIGTQQFFSVPYAMFAKEAQSVLDTISIAAGGNYRFLQLGSQKPVVFYVGDGDTSALNELQELVRLGGKMGLKNADGSITYTVNLPDSSSINELQMISQAGNTITLSQGGGSVTIDIDDADADPNNEIQTLSKSGTTITLNKGGGSITDSDNQTLSFSGSSLSISSGNSVTLPDSSASNELQRLSLSGASLSISSGNSVTLPDTSSSNELQTLSKSGNKISLSGNGGQVVDNDSQMLSYSNGIVSLERGGSFYLPDTSASNEFQSLSITPGKGTIALSNGGSVILNDSSSINELQILSISNDTLSISKGNKIKLPGSSSQGVRIGFSSSVNWTCPAGVTSIIVELWAGAGGGGGGGTSISTLGGAAGCNLGAGCYKGGAGGNGGNGGYNKATLSVTPGVTYMIKIGQGGKGGAGGVMWVNWSGTDGTDGDSSSFGNLLKAAPGKGGGAGISTYSTTGTSSCSNGSNGQNGSVINYNLIKYPIQGINTARSYIPVGYVNDFVNSKDCSLGGNGGNSATNCYNYGNPTNGVNGNAGESGYCVIIY